MSLSNSYNLACQSELEPIYTMTSDATIISPKPVRRVSFDTIIRLAVALEVVTTIRILTSSTTDHTTTSNTSDLLAGSFPEYQRQRGGQFGAIGSGRVGVIGGERRMGGMRR